MNTIEHLIGELFIKANLSKSVDIEVVQMLLGVEYEYAISMMTIIRHKQAEENRVSHYTTNKATEKYTRQSKPVMLREAESKAMKIKMEARRKIEKHMEQKAFAEVWESL